MSPTAQRLQTKVELSNAGHALTKQLPFVTQLRPLQKNGSFRGRIADRFYFSVDPIVRSQSYLVHMFRLGLSPDQQAAWARRSAGELRGTAKPANRGHRSHVVVEAADLAQLSDSLRRLDNLGKRSVSDAGSVQPDRVLFMRTAWMKNYCGLPAGEEFRTSAARPRERGFGHEVFNFRPYNGRMYGFAKSPGRDFKIERLGASKGDDQVPGVLVVWTAPHPERGVVIVGWYQNATVYRSSRQPPVGSGRNVNGEAIGYNVSAKARDCTLLQPPDRRQFRVPHMGEALIWYAEDRKHRQFLASVHEYVKSGGVMQIKRRSGKRRGNWQKTVQQRLEIENAAVRMAGAYFENFLYHIEDVGMEKRGWDLEARRGGELLKIEVKGRSGSEVLAELTPNEYCQLEKNRDTYRVCIVTNASSPTARLHVFASSPDSDSWESDDGLRLNFELRTGAIISAVPG